MDFRSSLLLRPFYEMMDATTEPEALLLFRERIEMSCWLVPIWFSYGSVCGTLKRENERRPATRTAACANRAQRFGKRACRNFVPDGQEYLERTVLTKSFRAQNIC